MATPSEARITRLIVSGEYALRARSYPRVSPSAAFVDPSANFQLGFQPAEDAEQSPAGADVEEAGAADAEPAADNVVAFSGFRKS